eukprot:1853475-Prymnesium_polylepis.2
MRTRVGCTSPVSRASRRAPAREAQATSKADSLVARRSAGLGDLELSPVGDMDRGSKTRGLMEGAFWLHQGRNAAVLSYGKARLGGTLLLVREPPVERENHLAACRGADAPRSACPRDASHS